MLNKANLLLNNLVYKRLRARALRAERGNKPIAEVCKAIEACAQFTFRNHVGLFSDGRLENIAWYIGVRLDPKRAEPQLHALLDGCPSGTTLHVVSNVYATGGHSRMLAKWINRDRQTPTLLVFTRPQAELPEFFSAIINGRNIPVLYLGEIESLENRAIALRLIAARSSRVILHTNPDDVLPVLAFSVNENQVPIALFNHAHYWFCLGSTVAAIYINTRDYFSNISQRHRQARAACVLRNAGGELLPYSSAAIDKAAAKRALGYPLDQVMLLTMASSYYFKPAGAYDFFRTMQTLLERHAHIHFVFVGLKPGDSYIPDNLRVHPRIQYAGNIEDPNLYYQAADLFLESFPRPSLSATVQAVAIGEAYPVEPFSANENINMIDRSDLFIGTLRPTDEVEYLALLDRLVDSPLETRATARHIRENIIRIDAEFENNLQYIYAQIDGCEVVSGPIPAGRMIIDQDTLALVSQSVGLSTRMSEIVRLPDFRWSERRKSFARRLRNSYQRHIQWRIDKCRRTPS